MYNLLYGIKDIGIKYPIDYVDCFERPIAFIYNWLKPGINELFIAYRKMYQSYEFDIDDVDNIFKNYEDEIGIRCNKVVTENNCIDIIIKLIDNGHPVVVPGNLKALYYSKYYLQDNWPHLFLIKGYDTEKKLFYMLESTQQYVEDDIPQYVDYPILFENLQQVFHEYSIMRESNIYYFDLVNSDLKYHQILKKCFQLLYDALLNQRYIEYEILKEIDDMEEIHYYSDYILNIAKYRITMIETLMKCMQQLSYDTSRIAQIVSELSGLWKFNNLLVVRKLQKKGTQLVKYTVTDKTVDLEQQLLLEILNCISFLTDISLEFIDKDLYQYENNEDNIIEYIDKQFNFNFSTGRIYNSWLTDHCPKVYIYNEKKLLDAFRFQVTCTVINKSCKEGHQEGIFFRTASNLMYTFAMDYMKLLVFDFVGRHTVDSHEYAMDNQTFSLFVKFANNILSYGFITEDNLEIECGQYRLNEKIRQVGIFCKTWNECKNYKLSFKDFQIDFK